MKDNTTRSWSRKKLLAYSLFTVLVILILLDGICRIYFFAKYHGLHTSLCIQGSPLQDYDSATVYKNKAYYVDYEKKFQYNEQGMKSRCGDFRMPVKRGNSLWVLLLGGSAMEGMGSNQNDKWFDITNVSDHIYQKTIAAYLENLLQRKYPTKEVRVFNAAVTGFTIHQSFATYQSLSKSYNFDWVISMDGVNDPDSLSDHENSTDIEQTYWARHPSTYFPLKYVIPITKRSALFNTIKQKIFYVRLKSRINKNIASQFPERRFWEKQRLLPIAFAPTDEKSTKAAYSYIQTLHTFENQLKQDNKKYLLLAQPYLAFRNPTVLSPEEVALDKYLRKEYNDKYRHTFLRSIYDSVNHLLLQDHHIQNMTSVYNWQGWTFVDYCHFTTRANQRIANELSDYIISGGDKRIFTK